MVVVFCVKVRFVFNNNFGFRFIRIGGRWKMEHIWQEIS